MRKLTGLGAKCHVKAWIPPKRMSEIAGTRTAGMVDYYLTVGRRTELFERLRQLETLARSCYMQGVIDSAEALAREAAPDLG